MDIEHAIKMLKMIRDDSSTAIHTAAMLDQVLCEDLDVHDE